MKSFHSTDPVRTQAVKKPPPVAVPRNTKSVAAAPKPEKKTPAQVLDLSSGEPPQEAPLAPKGLGIEVPAPESWPNADAGLLALDDFKTKFKVPASDPSGDWTVQERGNGSHFVRRVADKENKDYTALLEVEFREGKVVRIQTGDEAGRQVKVWFDRNTGKVSSVEHRLNGVLDGNSYQYYPDGSPKAVSGYKAVGDSYTEHGRKARLDDGGLLSSESFYENGKQTGVWKVYKGGKLQSINHYKNDRKNGIQATYQNGKLLTWHTARDGEIVGEVINNY